MPYCGDTTLVKHTGEERDISVLRCRSWHCAECAPRRRSRLIAEAMGGDPVTFLTLTSRRIAGANTTTQAKQLINAWRLVRLRAMRKYKVKSIPFIAVVEATAAGVPHLHILTRTKYLDQAWLSTQMAELIDSPIVDIRRVDHKGRIAAYVGKYLGKNPHQFGTCKRYWKSRDYERRPDRLTPRERIAGSWFDRLMSHFNRVVANHRQMGYVVTVTAPFRAHARPPDGGFWTVPP